MIEINISEKYVEKAKEKDKEIGVLKNSFTEGEGGVAGILGEMISIDEYNLKGDHDSNHDAIGKGKKVEIKTKRCNSKPQEHYNCSISKHSKHQKCDYYIFVRVLENYSKGWILGYISQKEFYKKATFNEKGEIDKTSTFGWTFKEDCYNLPASKLNVP